MTPELVTAFLVSFVGGPVGLGLCIRASDRRGVSLLFGIAALGCAAVSVWLSRRPDALPSVPGPLASLAALWLGWILTLATTVHALRPRMGSVRARRALIVTAFCATTLPWFGLATARMIG